MKYYFAVISSLVIAFLAEFSYGRLITCKCGYIKFWHGITASSENSQHITDWYTFSHIIHGFGFYYLGRYLFGRLNIFQSFLLALVLETVWEIVENSSFIINRYRESTISLDYFGDSILNSISDILAMTFGFYLAKRLALKWVILLVLVMELGVGYIIRDNLILNIIMLIYPSSVIKNWQLGA